MKYYLDTEFLDAGKYGDKLSLISVGIVAEDGRMYYAVREAAPWHDIMHHEFLRLNVVPRLGILQSNWKPDYEIKMDLEEFFRVGDHAMFKNNDTEIDYPEVWAWVAAYDWVALMSLWGPLSDRPKGMPIQVMDLKQEAIRQGRLDRVRLIKSQEPVHNALADAQLCARRGGALFG